MQKMKSPWTGKKPETNPVLKEQHQQRKTKEELIHRWQEEDWDKQLREYDELYRVE